MVVEKDGAVVIPMLAPSEEAEGETDLQLAAALRALRAWETFQAQRLAQAVQTAHAE